MINEYHPNITERKIGIGLSIMYCVGATIATYYTWPWGFLFFGPTIGGAIHYSYSIRNRTNWAYQRTSEMATQTYEKDQDEGLKNVKPKVVTLGSVEALAPSAPPILTQFNNQPIPGGINPESEGQPENKRRVANV